MTKAKQIATGQLNINNMADKNEPVKAASDNKPKDAPVTKPTNTRVFVALKTDKSTTDKPNNPTDKGGKDK